MKKAILCISPLILSFLLFSLHFAEARHPANDCINMCSNPDTPYQCHVPSKYNHSEISTYSFYYNRENYEITYSNYIKHSKTGYVNVIVEIQETNRRIIYEGFDISREVLSNMEVTGNIIVNNQSTQEINSESIQHISDEGLFTLEIITSRQIDSQSISLEGVHFKVRESGLTYLLDKINDYKREIANIKEQIEKLEKMEANRFSNATVQNDILSQITIKRFEDKIYSFQQLDDNATTFREKLAELKTSFNGKREELADKYYNRGIESHHRFGNAEHYYKEAIVLDDKHRGAHVALAELYLERDQKEKFYAQLFKIKSHMYFYEANHLANKGYNKYINDAESYFYYNTLNKTEHSKVIEIYKNLEEKICPHRNGGCNLKDLRDSANEMLSKHYLEEVRNLHNGTIDTSTATGYLKESIQLANKNAPFAQREILATIYLKQENRGEFLHQLYDLYRLDKRPYEVAALVERAYNFFIDKVDKELQQQVGYETAMNIIDEMEQWYKKGKPYLDDWNTKHNFSKKKSAVQKEITNRKLNELKQLLQKIQNSLAHDLSTIKKEADNAYDFTQKNKEWIKNDTIMTQTLSKAYCEQLDMARQQLPPQFSPDANLLKTQLIEIKHIQSKWEAWNFWSGQQAGCDYSLPNLFKDLYQDYLDLAKHDINNKEFDKAQRNLDEAKDLVNQHVKINDNEWNAIQQDKHQAHYVFLLEEGQQHINNWKYQEALMKFEEAESLYSTTHKQVDYDSEALAIAFFDAYIGLGKEKLNKGDFKGAKTEYNNAKRKIDNYKDALTNQTALNNEYKQAVREAGKAYCQKEYEAIQGVILDSHFRNNQLGNAETQIQQMESIQQEYLLSGDSKIDNLIKTLNEKLIDKKNEILWKTVKQVKETSKYIMANDILQEALEALQIAIKEHKYGSQYLSKIQQEKERIKPAVYYQNRLKELENDIQNERFEKTIRDYVKLGEYHQKENIQNQFNLSHTPLSDFILEKSNEGLLAYGIVHFREQEDMPNCQKLFEKFTHLYTPDGIGDKPKRILKTFSPKIHTNYLKDIIVPKLVALDARGFNLPQHLKRKEKKEKIRAFVKKYGFESHSPKFYKHHFEGKYVRKMLKF